MPWEKVDVEHVLNNQQYSKRCFITNQVCKIFRTSVEYFTLNVTNKRCRGRTGY